MSIDEAKLAHYIAKNEIYDVLVRYCHAIDRQDEALLRTVFHPEAIDVHCAIASTVDEFIGWVWPYHGTQKFHQHYISNHTCEIEGDVAHSEVYYQFVGTYPEPSTRMTHAGGRYVDRLERRNGEWRIATRYCTAEWYREVEMPAAIPMPIDPACLVEPNHVTRDASDISYLRPLTATKAGSNA